MRTLDEVFKDIDAIDYERECREKYGVMTDIFFKESETKRIELYKELSAISE